MQLFCCVNTSYHYCAIKVQIIINNNAAKWTKLIKRLEDNNSDVSLNGDKTNYTIRQNCHFDQRHLIQPWSKSLSADNGSHLAYKGNLFCWIFLCPMPMFLKVLMLTEPVDLLSHNCVTKSHKIKFDSISGCAKVAVHETLTTQHILSILSPDPIVISQPQPAPSWSISNKG